MKTILVTGKDSQLSQCIQDIKNQYPKLNFIFKSSKALDITNNDQLELFFNTNTIDYCINCAAYTAVDKAEIEKEKATKVNFEGIKNLVNICNEANATLIHISTDFVFNGNSKKPYLETDKTDPINVYGKTKRKGELKVIENSQKYFIIRTSWLYSEYGTNFLKTMLKLSNQKDKIDVVNDQIGSPTYAKDLAEVILKFIDLNILNYGIYNYSNSGEISWYQFAKTIFKILNISIKTNSISSKDYKTLAKRPDYSVLNTNKIRQVFDIDIPNWEISLKKAISNLNE
ncbi:dTDP-4-dehydrorhamnose reductase [Winogradskyella immobilis]|uniref:dTDP-4-dehydrorhamnose reductase n=1 Tax=Winogradskyella immobilis TaxID=2816852 RepID=A0ABS8EKV1_9FLAO|nr:dTDP-4-dehydrorhamnose reductase [Winogradskyella immobilis]MCC1483472.1 dTDP-4-dehydrorhamnose reductase [Winogradskyella immobilis]MCG0015566.1 dTDP-4-dehydrorhamnose reductase [Winogradskyella immobilis]